jgi:glycine cleavage system aminomethyltransferase T
MALTTHPNLAPRLKKKNYTYTPTLRPHGPFYGDLYLYRDKQISTVFTVFTSRSKHAVFKTMWYDKPNARKFDQNSIRPVERQGIRKTVLYDVQFRN